MGEGAWHHFQPLPGEPASRQARRVRGRRTPGCSAWAGAHSRDTRHGAGPLPRVDCQHGQRGGWGRWRRPWRRPETASKWRTRFSAWTWTTQDPRPGRGRRNRRRWTGGDRRERILRGLQAGGHGRCSIAGAACLLLVSGLFLYYGSDPEAAQPEEDQRLQAAPDDAGARSQRRADRDRWAAPSAGGWSPLAQIPEALPRRGHRRRGPLVLQTRGDRLLGGGALADHQRPGRAHRPGPLGAGRIDHHPAGGQAAAAVAGEDRPSQDPGDHPGAPAVAAAVQGRDPQHLRQPGQLRRAGTTAARRPPSTTSASPSRMSTLAEAAFLAGVPQRPESHSPYKNPESAKGRQLYVLRQMVQHGYLDEATANTVAKQPHRRCCRRPGPRPDSRPRRWGRCTGCWPKNTARRGPAHPGRDGQDHPRPGPAEAGAREPGARAGGRRPAAGLPRPLRPPRRPEAGAIPLRAEAGARAGQGRRRRPRRRRPRRHATSAPQRYGLRPARRVRHLPGRGRPGRARGRPRARQQARHAPGWAAGWWSTSAAARGWSTCRWRPATRAAPSPGWWIASGPATSCACA